MSYYEEETRALSTVLIFLYGGDGERAYQELTAALQQLTFPPSVRRLCEDALRQHADAKGVICLLQALETISGYKHIERYIVQRNQHTVFG
ncbi:hypothetical protein I6M88_12965 [Citrobacter sedlakii]|uniref:Uncharacterized protein n=1 Tax=Citrobacter sedlakii TaxID=67826 RepID=A0ABS0ZST7_9ENTR|nr:MULTISPECIES: hypothetical protein [Citrobacter]KSY32002.1 hypothetical protein APU02_05490 [Citrobacter sp. 50677481]MBJ8381875.1 hypothetical protein [Citrobacter sedlakii]HCA7080415.1 hypothetical protein [Citrobacter sedlakii]HCA7135063.1 hypothetical protein [Citrobacter sedlakii]HCA7183109.1 hypothetical protein [Citrobacter sedlakii]